MIVNLIALLVVLLLVILFGWLVMRAWRARGGVLKWVGLVVSALLTLLFAAVFVVGAMSLMRLNANYNADHPAANVTAARTPENLQRGERLAQASCVGCHGANGQLPLTGQNFGEDFPMPIGTLYTANLTPAGEIANWTDGEIIRAIREGVHKSGRSLLVMPSVTFHGMSDKDAQALVAYLRAQPPAGQATPQTDLNPIGMVVANLFNTYSVQPPITGPVEAPPEGPTVAYGGYLIGILGCRDCHGQALRGGDPGGFAPVGPDLTRTAGTWSEADFIKFFRTGTTPTGAMSSDEMPWKDYDHFATDDDLRALYQYIKSLPQQQGNLITGK